MGLVRNLSPSEIVGQVVAVKAHFGQEVRNVVFMGMGEPFDNFDNVIQAVRVLTDPAACRSPSERIAISTVGRTEGIRRLADLGWRRINLASRSTPPTTRSARGSCPSIAWSRWPAARGPAGLPASQVPVLHDRVRADPRGERRHEHALELVDYLRPVKCVVNVIPYNPRHESPWPAPDEETVKQFMAGSRSSGRWSSAG
jgi:23S rRNA (adenine2503-C2)-methyltransferase